MFFIDAPVRTLLTLFDMEVEAKVYFVLIAVGFVLGVIFATLLVSYFKDRYK